MGIFVEIKKGDSFALPPKRVTTEMIAKYADAANDHNPLHVDMAFAKTTRYGGIIAHGMLSMAFLQELMVRTFGAAWLSSGTIEVGFGNPVRPGDEVLTEAKVTGVAPVGGKENESTVRLQLVCTTGDGQKVISGKATVVLS